jgi:pimeloyl-ACP methyl ester carboxylesterase
MNHGTLALISLCAAALIAGGILTALAARPAQAADEDPPLNLARDGFFSVGGKPTTINGKTYVVGQMYVEMRIPQKQTHPYPIVMVHGGTRSGTTFTGTPDGRESWAQYFARRGYAVYVVDQPGRGRSGYVAELYGQPRLADGESAQRRYLQQGKHKLWPQADLHTQWPGSGEPDDPVTLQMIGSFLPEIGDFTKQQVLNRDALVALLDKIGPAILLTHSQAGAFGWPVADARPNLVKAIVAVEPNGPPVRGVEFVGAPDWFKEGGVSLSYGITSVPLTFDPPVNDAAELKFVKEAKPDGAGLLTCWQQAEPARKLVNLTMPIAVIMSEASYHAPYDHCTVKFLRQAGVKPDFIKLADLGIKGNSHVMMQEKNSKEIAAVIYGWLEKSVAAAK